MKREFCELNAVRVTALRVAMPCAGGLRPWALTRFEKPDVGAVAVLSTVAGPAAVAAAACPRSSRVCQHWSLTLRKHGSL